MQDPLFQIKRGSAPRISEDWAEASIERVVSAVDHVFQESRGESSFQSIFRLSRELCLYKKQDALFARVKDCVKRNVELQIQRLKERTAQEGVDWIAVVDDFWFHLHRSILTVASLLVYLSQGDRKAAIAEYALGEVKTLLKQLDDETGFIQHVYVAITEESQKARASFLEGMKSGMEEEKVHLFAEGRRKQIANGVDMLDVLGLFKELKQQFFARMQAFYRSYAYELLLQSSVPDYLEKVGSIVENEQKLARDLFKNRVAEEVQHQVLQSCVELFAAEMVTKGLAQMIGAHDFDALSRLYVYLKDVSQLETLQKGLGAFVDQLRDPLCRDLPVPEAIQLFRLLLGLTATCFAGNPQFQLEVAGRLMAVVNANMEAVCERLARWIDASVRECHEGGAMPERFVEDVLLVVNQMSQKESFEALYRGLLFQHLVTYGDVLLPEETRIIDEIKSLCGNVFVSRMDALAKDSLASREFTAYLRQQPAGAQLLQQCQFHVMSKDAAFTDEWKGVVLPPEILRLKEQFEALYHEKYASRVLQFLFEKSEYTVEYALPVGGSLVQRPSEVRADAVSPASHVSTASHNVSPASHSMSAATHSMSITPQHVLLVVNLPQYLILHAFSTVSSFTVGDLQTLTNLPLAVVLETVRGLAMEENGPLLQLTPGATDNAMAVSLCETPRFTSSCVRLIPAAQVSFRTQQAIPLQDMSAIHKTKVDAAIVRIIKNAKFLGFKDLVAKLNALLDFIPEEQFVKERVESLISKDYLERDEKDPSILVYQP